LPSSKRKDRMDRRLASYVIPAILVVVPANAEANQRLSAPVVFWRVGTSAKAGEYLANIAGSTIRVNPTRVETEVAAEGDHLYVGRAKKRILLTFLAASPNAQLRPSDPQSSRSNFYYGRDSGKWLTGVPGYRALLVENLYEGIDLQYRVVANEIEYDFIVHPGANPAQIREQITGD
jgi:hypothetical protein